MTAGAATVIACCLFFTACMKNCTNVLFYYFFSVVTCGVSRMCTHIIVPMMMHRRCHIIFMAHPGPT